MFKIGWESAEPRSCGRWHLSIAPPAETNMALGGLGTMPSRSVIKPPE